MHAGACVHIVSNQEAQYNILSNTSSFIAATDSLFDWNNMGK